MLRALEGSSRYYCVGGKMLVKKRRLCETYPIIMPSGNE